MGITGNAGFGRGAPLEPSATDPAPSPPTCLPEVSVIVAVYNGQDTIRDCLESLLALDYPRGQWELIVVDNASRDETPRILERYGRRLTILHEHVRGPAAARNRGLRHATGHTVAFTDADCVVDPRWLRHLVAPLQDRAVGIVGGRILARRPCNMIAQFGERIHDHRRAIQDVIPPYAITMNWASPRAALQEIGLFDPRLLRCSDVDLAFRLVGAGYRLVYEPDAIIYHRNRSTVRALMWEGYRHGYHAVPVLQRHRQFRSTYGARARTGIPWPSRGALRGIARPLQSMVQLAATPRELPWALCFGLAKNAGRLLGTLATAAVSRDGADRGTNG